ncbi:MAG: EamA family transporter [Pseudomonadota bacterium]
MGASGNWVLWAILSAVFAAATAVLAKLGLEGVNSDYATLVRATFIAVLLLAFVYATGHWISPLSLSRRNWLFLSLSAVATGASWVCYFRALQIGEASKVAPIDKLSVVLVAVFAVLFLGERPSFRDWTGISLVAAGALLLALKR